MKKFALIGAAGYVAPRHLKAIQDTGNTLLAAHDPHDAVGVMDSYFPDASFFTEFERFDRHVDKLCRTGEGPDYLTVCSPNYLHDAHVRYGLRQGMDVICEKPLVLNPWNIEGLKEMEQASGKRVYTILQLRLHPAVIELREKIAKAPADQVFDVDLAYITSRGKWYYASWKGAQNKSGGIATNIGIHFFDMLQWVFGPLQSNTLHLRSHDRESGLMVFERARVRWFLSINADTLPEEVKAKGGRTYRALKIDGQEWEFSSGFTDLHTQAYSEIIKGAGHGIEEARGGIEMVHTIRNAEAKMDTKNAHPFVHLPLSPHPFEK
ncbi:MAG: Gfo/Idh/MocA family oxidoreductase [Saprospiraceae bacterium]